MEPQKNRVVIAIVGPTCAGKTDVAFHLAKELNTEIISCDSRQVYKELTIGTAKPPEDYLHQVRHHFINHISINNNYNAGKFAAEALNVLEKLFDKGKIPIVVGGSGLYLNALIYGIFETENISPSIREKLQRELEEKGLEYLCEKLKTIDAEKYQTIDRNNSRRVIRALEVYEHTGIPISKLHREKHSHRNFNAKLFGLNWDRKKLYERINKRVDQMLSYGLIYEVRNVLTQGYDKNLNALQTVGYKEVIDYLESRVSYEEMVELIKKNTRRYAKRQMTWFRKNKNIVWFDVDEEILMKRFVQSKIIESLLRNSS
ncbi:MAG: tRNA (adenosine(37)-N6)-dimethylallyltransferase MiaA [Ignavibacteria bacterium]|nr:tRNA (adenosine(37)-N6)-dimethylallyltransferase MiaA [Ignavibacteria bacterium]